MSTQTRPAFAVDRSYDAPNDRLIPFAIGPQPLYAKSIDGALLVAFAMEIDRVPTVLNVAVRLDSGTGVLWTLLRRVRTLQHARALTEIWMPFTTFQSGPHARLRHLQPADSFNTSNGSHDALVTNALCDGSAFVQGQARLFGDGGSIATVFGDADLGGQVTHVNFDAPLAEGQPPPAQRLTLSELKIRQYLHLV